ncbi:MAG: flagellar biosynthesis protein FlhA [Pseudomonadota bacterium]|nr:flagellar biosynthesis protein FlhA [Pseudomonadota bacterium]
MRGGLGAPLLVVMVLAMMVLPLPPIALDGLFTFNISLSLVVLLATIYALRPLELGVFPTVLLVSTLLRLALNVASTRVVLLEGHTGTDAAGRVIESFGDFVIGGNYAVGLVVFAILVIINFVVVTKGAGRISEVSARFTLDAMPGKQMAIDADVNAGLISQEEARQLRQEVRMEADFYGSMDGASKFVRGDAIAGILILFINIIGGLAIGTLQHQLPVAEALRNYTLLTIGDGLVAQIPSLLLSTATAIIVTRMSQAEDMGQQVVAQLFAKPRALGVTGGVIGALGLIPGMPNVIFLALAGASLGAAYWLSNRSKDQSPETEHMMESEPPPTPPEQRDISWDDVQPVDMIGLEVGYRLIPLVDRNQGGELMGRIKGVRKKLSQEMGFLIPSVHIKDNLELPPDGYRILLRGVPVGQGQIHPERDMAINPGRVFGTLDGTPTKDPAFGMDALWIDPTNREHAQTLGYTVVDPSTVVATHLSHLLETNAAQLLGHEEAQLMLDALARTAPKLVEELVPKLLPLAVIVKVMRNLLEEGIPVRDIRTIAETLAEQAPKSQESGDLAAAVRIALSPQIIQKINGMEDELPVMTLDPALEQILQNAFQADSGGPGLEPSLAERLLGSLKDAVKRQESNAQPAVLLVPPVLRRALAKLTRYSIEGLHVLSYNEVPEDRQLRLVATIGG